MSAPNDFHPRALRKPNLQETQKIAKYLTIYYQSKIKSCKVFSTIFTVAGLLLMGAIGKDDTKTTVFTIFLGCICFFSAFKCIQSKNNCMSNLRSCSSGDFALVDGSVCKKDVNVDAPGFCNVWFVSDDETINDGWFRVRQENVKIGTPMMLAIMESKRNHKPLIFPFTDFMLTEEGMKLHL